MRKVAIGIRTGGAQGAGDAIHLIANYPVAAVQFDDGDGDDATALWPESAFARRYGIPINAQYVAVACLQSNVTVTLFKRLECAGDANVLGDGQMSPAGFISGPRRAATTSSPAGLWSAALRCT